MKKQFFTSMVLLALAGGGGTCLSQTASGHATPAAKDGPTGLINPDVAVKRTDKQIALAAQTDKLATLANELKEQVDKTNKNILSLKVVHEAEEIEQLAHRLKEQNKR